MCCARNVAPPILEQDSGSGNRLGFATTVACEIESKAHLRHGGRKPEVIFVMKRLLLVLSAALLLVLGVASPALAVSPHFVSASAKVSGTNLVVSFKEAGLGTNQLISYTASADATATYVCVNRGGGNPSASNKTTVSGPVSASGTFSSGKNGNVTASLTLNPPGPGSFSCPSGQSLEIAEVVYTNVAITDTTNGITEPIPGTFDTGCLLPNVRGAC
jgi:hypothetical protein